MSIVFDPKSHRIKKKELCIAQLKKYSKYSKYCIFSHISVLSHQNSIP